MKYRNTGLVLLLVLFFVTPATADTTPPVITLNGNNPETVQVGTPYSEAGATVTDDNDTGLAATITGSVNTAVVGVYTLTYNAEDLSSNAATPVIRTVNVVDTTRPVIILNGNNPDTVQAGTPYTEAGATVTDNYDTGLAATITGSVDTAVAGVYTLTYNATDSSGNAATPVTRTVNVVKSVDTTPPVITLNGDNPDTVQVGTPYTEAGATVTDNNDTGLTATITGSVDTAVAGVYTLTYNAIDSSGNAATPVTRTVNVVKPVKPVDKKPPVITLNGDNPDTVQVGTPYTEAGATVTDNHDTGLTATITGSVNTAVVGVYTLTYNAVDSSGNAATPVTRTVIVKYVDTTPPVITLNGDNPDTVQAGTTYTEAGATVTDNNDTGLTATIIGSVNTAVAGVYTLTYNAVDSSGNAATPVTRTVNVIDTIPPAWYPTTPTNQTVQVGQSFSYDVRATDASTIIYSINDTTNFAIKSVTGLITNATELSVGTYGLNITATDASSNSISQIITVTVQAEPTYSLSGYVFDNNNEGLAGVNIQKSTHFATSSGSGYYIISGLVNGSYNFSYSKPGFNTDHTMIVVSGSDVSNANKTVFDTTPPDQVTGLANDTPTQATVNLGWSSTANATHYQIFRNSSLIGTTKNTYWNETGLEKGTLYQYWVRANDSYNNWGQNSSTLNMRTAISTVATISGGRGSSGGGGGRGGGGGGGGGGASGENFLNIIVKEKYDLQIYKDIITSYKFTNINNPILSINIVGNVNAGEIGTAVEVLRNTSSLVKTSAPGNVYKNVNMWVGTSGFGTSKNIKEAVITFRVEKSWISQNNIKNSIIKMVRWDGSKWDQLETSEKSKDNTFIYFEAKSNSFSSFAITGIETNGSITENALMKEQLEPAKPVATIQPGGKKSDFLTTWFLIIGVFFAIGLIIEMYFRMKKK